MSLRERIQAAALRFADELVAAIEGHQTAGEWVDQYNSPLGKRRHLEAARRGELGDCSKDGRRVLATRGAIEAYMQARVIPRTPAQKDNEDDVMAELGVHRAGGKAA